MRRYSFLTDTSLCPRTPLFIEELGTIAGFCSIHTDTSWKSMRSSVMRILKFWCLEET